MGCPQEFQGDQKDTVLQAKHRHRYRHRWVTSLLQHSKKRVTKSPQNLGASDPLIFFFSGEPATHTII